MVCCTKPILPKKKKKHISLEQMYDISFYPVPRKRWPALSPLVLNFHC